MTNQKTTRRALITSLIALLFCFAMLIGTTFAWFTDSAIVYSNKIVSGNLDIVLEMQDAQGNWVDAQAQTLNFKKANGEDVTLWEPGATYELPKLRVRNNGNLAAKFMVQVSGINGDAALNDVITWEAAPVENDTAGTFISLTNFCAAERTLPANNDVYTFQIRGTMSSTAGNEYKNLTGNISVTIVATQLSGTETDLNGSSYDENATYPTVVYVNNPEELETALETAADGATIYMNAGSYDISEQFDILGKSVNIIGLGNVTVNVTGNAKAFYITGGNGTDGINVRLENITIDAPSSKGSIWLRTNSSYCTPGNINLTLDNVSAPSIQTDNNYDNNITFNIKLTNSKITDHVNLEAKSTEDPDTTIDTYTNFTYDAKSTVSGLKVQKTVKDAALKHITVNGVVPTEKDVVLN